MHIVCVKKTTSVDSCGDLGNRKNEDSMYHCLRFIFLTTGNWLTKEVIFRTANDMAKN